MSERIGFLGIGAMGQPMAANLLRRGFPVTVAVHRRPEPARALEAQGARIAPSPRDLIADATIVIACVPTSTEVEEVVLGAGGVLDAGRDGTIFVDMGTSRPASTRMLAARLRERRLAMVDAPITGGVRGATEGTLTIYAGGEPEAIGRVRPALEAMGRTILHMGPPGAGHVTKLLNQMLSQGSMALLAEVLPLGVRLGLDPAQMIEALSAGSGATFAIPGRGARILKNDFAPSFRLELGYKDLRLGRELAEEANHAQPMTSGALLTYALARGLGLDGEDTIALVKVWERALGVEVRATGGPVGRADPPRSAETPARRPGG
ncbi:MAG TPA: NAD(P)-dependent oxidoreductase [bacterium]|nr:NAD(P)-dependent oxidoreductase [bacterium]